MVDQYKTLGRYHKTQSNNSNNDKSNSQSHFSELASRYKDNNRMTSIATIRKEYIKCGKQMCELRHRPYYYAYWKDPESKKLKKRYVGDYMPKNKESNDDCTTNQVL